MGEITTKVIEQMRTPEAVEQMKRIQSEGVQAGAACGVAVPKKRSRRRTSDADVLASSIELAGLSIQHGLEAVAGAIEQIVGHSSDPSPLVITLMQSAEVLGEKIERAIAAQYEEANGVSDEPR